MIACAHKASGDPTVHSAAPARTEDPALQRMAHVCVQLDTEERPAKEVSIVPALKTERGSTVLTLVWCLKTC